MYLGHGYYIVSDKYQYVLEKRKELKTGKKAGEEVGRYQSYHPTVHAVCEALLRRLQRGELEDFEGSPEEAAKIFEAHLKEVAEMFKKAEHLKLEEEDERST